MIKILMIRIAIALFVIAVVKLLHWLLAHETILKLSKKRRNAIKQNGLVHYTSYEKAQRIVANNKLLGALDYKSTFPSHRDDMIVWFMSNQSNPFDKLCRYCVLRRHAPIQKNNPNHKVKYEAKILVKGFNDDQIANMKINIELGIGCYTDEISNVSISYAPLDNVDRKLGVKDIYDIKNK